MMFQSIVDVFVQLWDAKKSIFTDGPLESMDAGSRDGRTKVVTATGLFLLPSAGRVDQTWTSIIIGAIYNDVHGWIRFCMSQVSEINRLSSSKDGGLFL